MRKLNATHPALAGLIPTIIFIVLTTVTSGCGEIRDRDQKIVVVREPSAQAMAAPTDELGANLQKLRELIELYFEGDGISRGGLLNLIEKYKDRVAQFLGGAKLTTGELVDLLFKFDTNGDGVLRVSELADAVFQRIPILRWIARDQAIDAETLLARVEQEYPSASRAAHAGLAATMIRFDERWAGGNGDARLTRREASAAGLVLAVLTQVDYSGGGAVTPPPGAADGMGLAAEVLHQKMNQQIFGRHAEADFRRLPAIDAQAEWMQLALRFMLVDRLVRELGVDGNVPAETQAIVLSKLGPAQAPQWARLRAFHDSALCDGNNDGAMNTIEAFDHLTNLWFADAALKSLKGDVSAASVERTPAGNRFAAAMAALLPATGAQLLKSDYWDSIRSTFDAGFHGGSGDGRVDAGELAMALGYARVLDQLYARFDADGDRVMTKVEAKPLFAQFGLDDSQVIDAFFADVGLDGRSPGFWKRLKKFFSGATKITRLGPREFYSRLTKVMPRLLDSMRGGKPIFPPRNGD